MHKRPAIHLHVRTKTWIENDRQELLFGKGKTEILELFLTNGWENKEFIAQRTEDIDELTAKVAEYDLDRVEKLTGAAREKIIQGPPPSIPTSLPGRIDLRPLCRLTTRVRGRCRMKNTLWCSSPVESASIKTMAR